MKGIGTDIVQVDRIRKSYAKQEERFVRRILTDDEQAVFLSRGKSMQFLANRFAAKEAIAKALGTGIAKGIVFTDLQILPSESGAPVVTLFNQALNQLNYLGGTEVKISISDERDYAVAFAVVI